MFAHTTWMFAHTAYPMFAFKRALKSLFLHILDPEVLIKGSV